MGLVTLPKVEKLQAALHAKAKRSPQFRFYTLYDKVYRQDVLWQAYRQCRHNGGAPGVDGVTFPEIEEYGLMKWLGELAEPSRWAVDHYVYHRVRQWWCAKHKVRNRRDARFSETYLYQQAGVIRLRDLGPRLSCAQACETGPRAGCGKSARPVR